MAGLSARLHRVFSVLHIAVQMHTYTSLTIRFRNAELWWRDYARVRSPRLALASSTCERVQDRRREQHDTVKNLPVMSLRRTYINAREWVRTTTSE